MKRALPWIFASIAAVVFPTQAAVLSYFAENLPDAVVGEDLWQYQYRLDSFEHDAGYGFTTYFDPALYADLDPSPQPPNADWEPIRFAPDPQLGEEGIYDAEALVDAPAIDAVFTISFRWLGGGAPGSQPFEVREPAPSYAVIESGETVLPEADAAALGAGALAAIATLRRIAA